MSRLLIASCTVVMVALLSVTAQAQKYEEPQTDDGTAAAQPRERVEQQRVQSETPSETEARLLVRELAGMQVAIDPRTGKLRQPTATEAAALSKALRRLIQISPDAHRISENGDGSISMILDESYMDVMTASVGPDGVRFDCEREQPEDCVPDEQAQPKREAEVK